GRPHRGLQTRGLDWLGDRRVWVPTRGGVVSTLDTIPVPYIDHGVSCLLCREGEGCGWWVHLTTAQRLVLASVDEDEVPDSQGWHEVCQQCLHRVPRAYRRRLPPPTPPPRCSCGAVHPGLDSAARPSGLGIELFDCPSCGSTVGPAEAS